MRAVQTLIVLTRVDQGIVEGYYARLLGDARSGPSASASVSVSSRCSSAPLGGEGEGGGESESGTEAARLLEVAVALALARPGPRPCPSDPVRGGALLAEKVREILDAVSAPGVVAQWVVQGVLEEVERGAYAYIKSLPSALPAVTASCSPGC